MPADSSSKPRSGKDTQIDPGVYARHSCQKTWESTVENGQQAKQSQACHWKKNNTTTANRRTSSCTLMAQSTRTSHGGASLSSFVISNRILQHCNKHKTSSLFYLCSTALPMMHRQCCLTVTVLCSLMAPTYWGHGPGFPGANGIVDALFLYRFSYPLVAENQPVKAGPRLQLLDRTS